jgi:hypothetical protein
VRAVPAALCYARRTRLIGPARSAVGFTLTRRIGLDASVIRPSISTPDMPILTGSPTTGSEPNRPLFWCFLVIELHGL